MNTPTLQQIGFSMQGLQASVAQVVLAVCERFDSVTYLEIGVGWGQTLAGVSQLLQENVRKQWRTIGVDLNEGYSLDMKQVRNCARVAGVPLNSTSNLLAYPVWGEATVYLADSQTFLRDYWDQELNLVLIDACHCKECVMNDFRNIEPHVVPHGTVMFHDFGADQVGQPQPHNSSILDVNGACKELGLLDQNRAGWRFLETLIGTKSEGAADMGIFERQ